MGVVLVTGALGLIGSEAARHFADRGFQVVGIDGAPAAAGGARRGQILSPHSEHHHFDIRDRARVLSLFECLNNIALVIHTAAHGGHDGVAAARDPFASFDVNAGGTLNLLEATRRFAPLAPFILTSTNQVYGDAFDRLPLVEHPTRFEIAPDHPYESGIPEDTGLGRGSRGLFGASKAAADALVQEWGRTFGLYTACFRTGTIAGPRRAAAIAADPHDPARLMECALSGALGTVFGFKGKQVRDVLHASDLVRAFHAFFNDPRIGEVYHLGGGRSNDCSLVEMIDACQHIAGRPLRWTYHERSQTGEALWWVADNAKFQAHYPGWKPHYDLDAILCDCAAWYEERRTVCAYPF